MKKKILVAMSGGVDSSLTAALLLERDFDVKGVTMLLEEENFHESGEIVDTCGKILGSHSGVANYTIGQRKGLGIAVPNPL